MSSVVCKSIQSRQGGNITLTSGTSIINPGSVVQALPIRTNALTTYAAAATGDGTRITDLDLVITPKQSNSTLIMQWMLNCEVNQDVVFLIHKNTVLITAAGYEGRNSVGNQRYIGYSLTNYDNNTSSTMSNFFIQYAIPAYSTDQQTFSLAVRASSGTAQTLYLNRTQGSATGAASYEIAVSTGFIMEVAGE